MRAPTAISATSAPPRRRRDLRLAMCRSTPARNSAPSGSMSADARSINVLKSGIFASEPLPEGRTGPMQPGPHGRGIDPEHPAGFLGVEADPLHQDQCLSPVPGHGGEERSKLNAVLAALSGVDERKRLGRPMPSAETPPVQV